jgi:hypothetical protein
MKTMLAVFAICTLVHAQDLEITSFHNDGTLLWNHAPTSGTYTVEWSSSLTNDWHHDWKDLVNVPASSGVYRVDVPMYYRVVYSDPCVTNHVTGVIGTGDGANKRFAFATSNQCIVRGSASVTDGGENWSDFDGDGQMTSNLGIPLGNAFINYVTGAISVTFSVTPANAQDITFTYLYSTCCESQNIHQVAFGLGNGADKVFSGVLANSPIVVGSLSVTDGVETWSDFDGDGTLTSGLQLPTGTGTINYQTGSLSVTFTAPPSAGATIVAIYATAD